MRQRGRRAWLEGRQGDYGDEVLDLLSAYGIPVVASRVAATREEAVRQAGELGFPVVMKVVSPDALHKSDAGGVIVGLEQPAQVEGAFERIRGNLLRYKRRRVLKGFAPADGAGRFRSFVGGKHDPSFGPVVFFGLGGIYIELFRDVANALCPAEANSIRKRLERLKAYGLLKGLRGQAPGDVDAFIDLVVRVSHLLADFPQIQELDINPVRVFSAGSGALALDARARIVEQMDQGDGVPGA